MEIFLIVVGVVGMGYGIWAPSRLRPPYDTLAALAAVAGLLVALGGTVALTVPGFFAGGIAAALEGVPAFTSWLERNGAAAAVYSLAFIVGALIGSFLNVCIVRLPNDESIVSPPSHCPACKAPVHFYDNIPLLSYIILGGRCRSCNATISPRYFFVELLTAVLAVVLFHRFGFSFAFFAYFIFVAALIVIAFIDLDVRIVPDVISLPGIGLGFAVSLIAYLSPLDPRSVLPSPLSSLLGIVIGGGFLLLTAWIYEYFTGVEGMGGGDVKLLGMIGAFLGWSSIPVVLFTASLAGSVIGLAVMLVKRVGGKYALPFAPFLCLGALFYLFFSDKAAGLFLPLG